MNAKTILYMGLFIALSGCTGIGGENLTSVKGQSFEHSKSNHPLSKDKSAQHTKRMMAWINISKD